MTSDGPVSDLKQPEREVDDQETRLRFEITADSCGLFGF